MDHVSLHSQTHTAFSSIVSFYQEHKHNGGLYPLAENATVSTSDLLCEVELAARRTLDSAELHHFEQYMKSGVLVVEDADSSEFDNELHTMLNSLPENLQEVTAATDARVRAKLGRHFIAAGIYPLSKYAGANIRTN